MSQGNVIIPVNCFSEANGENTQSVYTHRDKVISKDYAYQLPQSFLQNISAAIAGANISLDSLLTGYVRIDAANPNLILNLPVIETFLSRFYAVGGRASTRTITYPDTTTCQQQESTKIIFINSTNNTIQITGPAGWQFNTNLGLATLFLQPNSVTTVIVTRVGASVVLMYEESGSSIGPAAPIPSQGIVVSNGVAYLPSRTLLADAASPEIEIVNPAGQAGNPTFNIDYLNLTAKDPINNADIFPIYDPAAAAKRRLNRSVLLRNTLKTGSQYMVNDTDFAANTNVTPGSFENETWVGTNIGDQPARYARDDNFHSTIVGADIAESGVSFQNVVIMGDDVAPLATDLQDLVAIGSDSFQNYPTGLGGIYIGNHVGNGMTAFGSHTIIGNWSGNGIATGNRNIVIGDFTAGNASMAAVSDVIVIGWNFDHGSFASGNTYIKPDYIDTAAGDGTLHYNTTTGAVTFQASSERLKKNIQEIPLEESIKIVKSLVPKSFSYKHDPDDKILSGFIAEDVEKIDKKLVSYTKDKEIPEKDIPLGLQFNSIWTHGISAIKNLIARVETLESELKQLKDATKAKSISKKSLK